LSDAGARNICRRKNCECRGPGVSARPQRDVKQILRFLAILLSIPAGLIALAVFLMLAGWIMANVIFR
jgi:hypothetical protein